MQVDDGSVTATYAEMEGIRLLPQFDRERYKAPFLESRLHPTFFEKGCIIPEQMWLDYRPETLEHWKLLSEDWGASDYYSVLIHQQLDPYYLDKDLKLLCAVVDLSPKVIEAAFVKLAGKASGGVYSKHSLLLIGAALWRTDWCPVIGRGYSWAEYVESRNASFNRNRKREEERQAAVFAFMGAIE